MHADVGEHLVEIRAAIANPASATRLEKMVSPHALEKSPSPHKSSQDLRTVSLGPAAGMNGVAGYRILIVHGAVEKVEPTDQKVLGGGAERLKAAKLTGYSPKGSDAKMMHEVMLNCHSGVCEMVITP